MALTYRIENRAASTTVDLDGGADSIELVSRNIYRSGGLMTHALRIRVKGATRAATRTAVKTLEDILEAAVDWNRQTPNEESYWLREVTDGETARRALIMNYVLNSVEPIAVNTQLTLNPFAIFDLAITTGRWEEVYTSAITTTATTSSVNIVGGTWDLSATTGGRIDGRIPYFYVNNPGTQTIKRIWVGIRRPYHGLASFDPRLDAGAAGSPDTDTTIVSAAHPLSNFTDTGYAITSFATDNTLAKRFRLDIGDLDYAGRYLALMRYFQSGGTTDAEFAIRLTLSFAAFLSDEPTAVTNVQYLSETVYQIAELGEVEIPPGGLRDGVYDIASAGNMASMRLNVEAKRLSGDRSLVVDCILLIPMDAMFRWEGTLDASGLRRATVFTNERGESSGYTYVIGPPTVLDNIAGVSANGWRYPHEGGYLVLCATPADGTAQNETLATGMGITILDRWLTYAD